MRVTLAIGLAVLLAACGDKVPQSKAAKDVGSIPAQTRDRAVENTTKAIQQGADRNAEADKKQ
jgi:hypothetical protein